MKQRGEMAPPTRRTRQLLLRAPDGSDIDALFAIQGNPTAMRFTYCSPDREATVEYVDAYAARFVEDGFAPWTIVFAADGRVVGWGGLNRDPKAPHWGIEVAYFIDPTYWGRGLATELVQDSLAHAFGDLGLPEVGAFVRPDNHASIRVLTKAGLARVECVPELQRDRFRISAAQWSAHAYKPPQPTRMNGLFSERPLRGAGRSAPGR